MTDSSAPGEAAGDRIDRYELMEEIGEGGMGTVWMAKQTVPVERRVALKIVKLGMDTKAVVVRFEAERQALALMDHPHIAKVLDGGATDAGRPYFVMELVDGKPITEYCDEAKLDLRERLELFIKVCQGIQHAHQKGIIHRDIKPGNVLVTLRDGEPVPLVIDFGIAKATSAVLTEKTLLTQPGNVVGTPEYMAPEQLSLGAMDIDTRVDVYSLGVLLYELLTGTKPFELRKMLDGGYTELMRTIREVEPEKPSTRISSSGDIAVAIAARRRVDAEALGKGLRGDLDWIVMKSLEKDRSRRYETANGFAADVARYLNNEPVVAAPPGAMYRARKFVQRRKKTVVAVSVISLLFLSGSIGTTVGLIRTTRANRALDIALGEKETQRKLAVRNEGRAKAEADRATLAEAQTRKRAAELQQVADFQAEQLRGLDPQLMGLQLREALIDAAPSERREALSANLAGINFTDLALDSLEENLFVRTLRAIGAQFEGQPLVRAQLLHVMADVLRDLGSLELALAPQGESLAIRRSELGSEHQDTLQSINNKGVLLFTRGELAAAEVFCREAMVTCRRVLGDEHADTLQAIANMGELLRLQGKLDEAERLFREAIDGRRRVLGDDHRETLQAILNLGVLLMGRGDYAAAMPFYEESLVGSRRVLGDDHRQTLLVANNMGVLLEKQGKYAEAEVYQREALEGRRRLLGDDHVDTLVSIHNLGTLFYRRGDYARAQVLYTEALEGYRRTLGNDHSHTLSSVAAFGLLLRAQGKVSEAEPYYRESLDGYRRTLGDDHSWTLQAMSNTGFLLQTQGKLEEAEAMYREALAGCRRFLSLDHETTLACLVNLGNVLRLQVRLWEAEPFYREALENYRRIRGDDHPATLTAINNLAYLLEDDGRLSEAEPLFREALASRRRVLGEDDVITKQSVTTMVRFLGNRVEAARQANDELALGEALAELGSLRLSLEEPALAEPLLEESFERLSLNLPDTDARTWLVLGSLGASIAAQGRFADAEPLLRESAEWLLENSPSSEVEPSDDAGLDATDAVQRIIEFYDQWHAVEPDSGHDSSADEWRALRK